MNWHLLDSHTFLWASLYPHRLSPKANFIITDPDTPCRLSLASVWEMAIKVSIGKLDLPEPLDDFIARKTDDLAVDLFPITLPHILRVATLPLHHRDPFDRLLASQAIHEGVRIVSADPAFDRYDVERVW